MMAVDGISERFTRDAPFAEIVAFGHLMENIMKGRFILAAAALAFAAPAAMAQSYSGYGGSAYGHQARGGGGYGNSYGDRGYRQSWRGNGNGYYRDGYRYNNRHDRGDRRDRRHERRERYDRYGGRGY